MTFIYEDGNGIPEANSYLNELDIANYLTNEHTAKWETLAPEEQKDCMVVASRFIDGAFKWVGQQAAFDQGLSWPRRGVLFQEYGVPSNIVPSQIRKACVMALEMILDGGGISVFATTQDAQVKREKFAVMEQEYFEKKYSNAKTESDYTSINNLLRGFYVSQSNGNMISVPVQVLS